MPPPTYPTLAGQSIDIIKRPKWSNSRAVAASGRDVRIALWSYPLWEWELNYEFLRDTTSPSELELLVGFFNSTYGGLTGFLFQDPDDHAVTAQVIGTGNGVTASFVIVRTYGGAAGSGTEPIGYLKDGATVNVYFDGVYVTPTGYDVDSTNPVAQLIVFHAAPVAGVVISVDVEYLYYVHFKDDSQDFERFLWQYYQARKVVLESLRR
jgi:uncharacterized protein (TIGR02217 family)